MSTTHDGTFPHGDDTCVECNKALDAYYAKTAEKTYVGIDASGVEYSLEAAEVSIDDFIAALQEAKADGATHVRLGTPALDYNPTGDED
jgi:hypothetical protein